MSYKENLHNFSINWSKASELVWKWVNGHIDLLTKENRKLLYTVAHDPEFKPSKMGEVSKDAIYKFKAKNPQLFCEMRKFSKYEDYIISKNNNIEIKSEPDDAEPQITTKKRPHTSGTGDNLTGPSNLISENSNRNPLVKDAELQITAMKGTSLAYRQCLNCSGS